MTKKKAGLIGLLFSFMLGLILAIDEKNHYRAGYKDGLAAANDPDDEDYIS